MAIRIVRLGTDRHQGEGLRIGTVRRPPRGIPKSEYASKNFYDVWLPTLAPSPLAVKQALAAPDPRAVLDLLAVLSRKAEFSIGCYCADETRCHRSVLRELLLERGAQLKR
ncbi:MAG: DUF488 domain-containing protein [Steroidobacterales bacterium]